MRKPASVIATVFIVAVSFVAARNAAAQAGLANITRNIETEFAAIESHRRQGDCVAWDRRLGDFQNYMVPIIASSGTAFGPAAKEKYRNRLAEAAARPCPATALPGRNTLAGLQAKLNYDAQTEEFHRRLSKANLARLGGDCNRFQVELAAARTSLAAINSAGYAPPEPRFYAEVLAEYVARPCPAPRSELYPPPPQARTDQPAAGGRCASIYRDQVAEGRGMTCRCDGEKLLLSVTGANPYNRTSAICNAAIHAGVLPESGIGTVQLVPVARAKAALGTVRNGISALNWDFGFDDGFTFAAAGTVPTTTER